MSGMTREEADIVAEEARQQGWEADKEIVKLSGDDLYNRGRGRVVIHDWDEINRYRREHDNLFGSSLDDATGCSVELVFPAWENPKYWLTSTDEWRQLKAKVDELKEIFKQLVQRGWDHESNIVKRGKFGMAIKSVYPPGYRRPYGVSVGGMRTWRKVCREAESILEQRPDAPGIDEGRAPHLLS